MIRSRSRSVLLSALLGCAVLASSAPAAMAADAPKASQRECFLSRNLNGFNAPDDHTLYVRSGVKDIYRLDLMSSCINLTFRQSVGLKSTGGSDWICDPLDAEVVYGDVGIPQRCPVTAIRKLTPDEVAALPKKDLP